MKKTQNKPLRRTQPIKRYTASKHREIVKRIEADKVFYCEVWQERIHKCGYCGRMLSNEPRTYYFDHVLEKSKFPSLRYEKKNIMLTCSSCHTSKTNGFLTDLMESFIFTVVKHFIKEGLLIEIGQPDTKILKNWIRDSQIKNR